MKKLKKPVMYNSTQHCA